MKRWSLRHAWRSESDLAALALCREQLRGVDIDLVDAGPGESASAVKMHGMEIVDALATDDRLLHDLRGVAVPAGWDESLRGPIGSPSSDCSHPHGASPRCSGRSTA